MNHVDLFSGIGGFSLGLERTGGFKTVAFCEIEEYPRKVLQKHWPYVKQYEDIRKLNYEKLKSDGIDSIDIITGGYPCQPFSNAGKKQGESDPRHLWPEMFRIIKECGPAWVIGENVSGHIKLGLDSVLSDLEGEGYGTRTFSVSAASVGANHKRERVWIVAHAKRDGDKHALQGVNGKEKKIQGEHRKEDGESGEPGGTGSVRKADPQHVEDARRALRPGTLVKGKNENETEKENADFAQRPGEASGSHVADAVKGDVEAGRERRRAVREGHQEEGFPGHAAGRGENPWEGWWTVEPEVGRMDHGIPKRVDRLKCLGNSLIPMIPFLIGRSIMEARDV